MELWPKDKIAAQRSVLESTGDAAPKGYAVVLTTGAMNPPHRGHAVLLHQAAARLEKDGYAVLGAYLSATHDNYVGPKCRRLGTMALSGAFRAEVARRAVQDDPLVAAGFWEVSQPGFEDFPDVSANCVEEFAGQARVFYACGTDHAERCGLTRGMRTSAGPVGIVVVPREGDRPPAEVTDRVWVAEPASGEIASFSSTKVRQALERGDFDYISSCMSPSAAELLLSPGDKEKAQFAKDYEKIRQLQPAETSKIAT